MLLEGICKTICVVAGHCCWLPFSRRFRYSFHKDLEQGNQIYKKCSLAGLRARPQYIAVYVVRCWKNSSLHREAFHVNSKFNSVRSILCVSCSASVQIEEITDKTKIESYLKFLARLCSDKQNPRAALTLTNRNLDHSFQTNCCQTIINKSIH